MQALIASSKQRRKLRHAQTLVLQTNWSFRNTHTPARGLKIPMMFTVNKQHYVQNPHIHIQRAMLPSCILLFMCIRVYSLIGGLCITDEPGLSWNTQILRVMLLPRNTSVYVNTYVCQKLSSLLIALCICISETLLLIGILLYHGYEPGLSYDVHTHMHMDHCVHN